MVEMQVDVELRCRGFEHADALGHDFGADAVSGDDCDAVLAHECSFSSVGKGSPA